MVWYYKWKYMRSDLLGVIIAWYLLGAYLATKAKYNFSEVIIEMNRFVVIKFMVYCI